MAFAIGWFISVESRAYPLAFGIGMLVIYAPFVFEKERPFDAGQGVLLLIPLAIVWFLLCVNAVGAARELNRMRRERLRRRVR